MEEKSTFEGKGVKGVANYYLTHTVKERGITLIALVITIIILLILAGVTLSLIWNGGIIQKSQDSADVYSEKGAEEKLTLKLAEYKFALTAKEEPILEEYLYQVSDEVTVNGDRTYMVVVDGYEFIVQEDPLQIIGRNGPTTGEKPKITSVKKDYIADKNWVILKVTAEGVVGGEITVDIGGKRVEPNEDGTFTILRNGTYRILVLEEGNRRRISQTVEVDEIQTIYYEVTLTQVTGATVEGGGTIEEEKSTEIKATVNSDYKFEYWEVTEGNEEDVEDLDSATTKVTPTDDITLKPVVTEISKYTVTLTAVTGVTYTGETKVIQGQSTTIEATLPTTRDFIRWDVTKGNASDVEDLYSAKTKITPTGNITLEAVIGIKMALIEDGNNLVGGTHGTANGTLNGKPSAYNNPVIPVGFKAVNWSLSADGKSVSDWDNGLVIMDATSDGNEFVWVPVHATAITENGTTINAVNYAKWCSGHTKYSFDQTSLPSGVTSETTQITNYGGFYIARYESYDAGSSKPGSKAGKTPWKVSYTNAKTYSKNLCNTSYVKSALATNKMWDTTMRWIENTTPGATSAKEYGNFTSSLKNTGSSNTYRLKNIYDLAGNVWDWTAGIFTEYSVNSTKRGGAYNGSSDYMKANAYDEGEKSYSNGFRMALYIL